jgi:hypothetical protein
MSKKFFYLAVFTLFTVCVYAQNTLNVNLSKSIGPVTHCATGALYGITESLPSDISGLLAPLHPNVYTQPARSGSGYQQPIGAALPVSARVTTTSAQVMIRLADMCPGWPYQWPGQATWLSRVTTVIQDKIASGRNNFYGYEIWNERHGTWLASNGDFETLCWKPTYDLIRSLDPTAKIIGPSDSYYLQSRISEFLTFCIANNCLPDIMCWHELQGSANITSHVTDYRSLERNLRVSKLPITINEYCHSTQAYEGCPGTSVPFIAKFERNLVQSACISWWFTSLPGRMGSLLTSGNQKGGGWWLYKWYGDMTGTMASVTPPNDYTDGMDGFACIDTIAQYASICLGGNYTGTTNVVINGIPSAFGDSATVKVEYVPWVNKDTPVSGPQTNSISTYSVANNTITVPVAVTSAFYAYHVYITPVGKLDAVGAARETAPRDFALNQNYPNPFNPTTTIAFTLPSKSYVSLKIFDMMGRDVATLVSEEVSAGTHSRVWDASTISSGVYFYRLQAGSFTQTRHLILLK